MVAYQSNDAVDTSLCVLAWLRGEARMLGTLYEIYHVCYQHSSAPQTRLGSATLPKRRCCITRCKTTGRAAQARSMGGVIPNFVVREVDAFLGCGILAHGLRLRCAHCTFNHLVAFSCKKRGFCPSCGARRMAERAAHWMDAVLPHVPIRQWVLSLPFALCFKAAFDADICLKIVTFFNRAVQRYVRHAAKYHGRVASVRHLHTGTVTCVQRFF